jgi:hypothetical protein
VPQRHAPLNPLGENVDLLPRAGGRRRGDEFRGRVRLEIFVVTVQFDDFKNVANPGHWNETTPCLVEHDEGVNEHETRGVQPGSQGLPKLPQRATVIVNDVAIMGPRLRESNILQLQF